MEPAAAMRDADEEAAGRSRSSGKEPRPEGRGKSGSSPAATPVGSKLSAVGTKPIVFYGAAIVLLGAAVIAMEALA